MNNRIQREKGTMIFLGMMMLDTTKALTMLISYLHDN